MANERSRDMSRITGVSRGGSILARVAFFFSRRKVGRVIQPVRVHALHSRLLLGYGHMEMAQEKADKVPGMVKSLAQVRVAMRVGCPF